LFATIIPEKLASQDASVGASREIIGMLRSISFDDKGQYPGLQVADVNAYSAYQHESGAKILETITLENPLKAVTEAKRVQKTPVFRLELREHELLTYKQFILDEIEKKRARHQPRGAKDPSSNDHD
jgi:hypothetical protein